MTGKGRMARGTAEGTAKRMGSGMGLALALVLTLSLGACYEHRYTIGTGAPNGTVVYNEWHNHWIGGLISPGQEIELAEVCRSGNATIHEEVTFLNGLVSGLTSGIYSPTTVKVRCENGRRSDLDLDAGQIEVFVLTPEFLEWVNSVAPHLAEEAQRGQAAALLR